MNLTMLRNCNTEEIELILADKDDPIINLLLDKVHEAETKVNESVEKAFDYCSECFKLHAGEEHHTEIIIQLQNALKENKSEMKEEIKSVIEKLVEMDKLAGNKLDFMYAEYM